MCFLLSQGTLGLSQSPLPSGHHLHLLLGSHPPLPLLCLLCIPSPGASVRVCACREQARVCAVALALVFHEDVVVRMSP